MFATMNLVRWFICYRNASFKSADLYSCKLFKMIEFVACFTFFTNSEQCRGILEVLQSPRTVHGLRGKICYLYGEALQTVHHAKALQHFYKKALYYERKIGLLLQNEYCLRE